MTRTRAIISVLGLACIIRAAFMHSVPVGLFVLGVCLLLFARALGEGDKVKLDEGLTAELESKTKQIHQEIAKLREQSVMRGRKRGDTKR